MTMVLMTWLKAQAALIFASQAQEREQKRVEFYNLQLNSKKELYAEREKLLSEILARIKSRIRR